MADAHPAHNGVFNTAPPPQPRYPGEINPLIKDRAQRKRGIFSPGQRIRMNIVPMFLSLFVPWGTYIYCSGITSFNVMYFHPGIGVFLLCIPLVLWVGLCIVTFMARKWMPDPTWYTYIAIMVAVFGVWGVCRGMHNFRSYSLPFYQIQALRDLRSTNGDGGIDASQTKGADVMDAGIFLFGAQNHFDEAKSWHFKQGSLYCVVPIISHNAPPVSQEYDFWAVGKDCCSDSSSDFRCSAWKSDHVKAGVRLLEGDDLQYYKLAVQQAESVYNIRASHPIFMTMYGGTGTGSESDDLNMGWNIVNSWTQIAWKNFLVEVTFSLVVSAFSLTLALVRFSCLGRLPNPLDVQLDPEWQHRAARGYTFAS